MPWSATDENLAGWAALKSVTQKPANAGTNNATIFTGTAGATLPAGTVLNRGDGYQYTTDVEIEIGAAGTATGTITAVLPDPNDDPTGGGDAGNTPAGTQLTLDVSISGVDSTATISTAITDGANIETEDASTGGQSAKYFIGVARAIGYAITITFFRQARAGMSVCGDALNGDEWPFVWLVTAPQTTITYAQSGISYCGDPLRSWGNKRLECRLTKLAPSHTIVLFGYAE